MCLPVKSHSVSHKIWNQWSIKGPTPLMFHNIPQDMCKGNAAVCGSLCLDHSGTDLMSRVSNKVYEHCRSGAISLPGFPDFNPIIHALKSHQPVERQKSFRVSVQQMDRLVVLQSLAQKWLDTESTRERALKIISDHNDTYNCDGQYWLEERSGTIVCSLKGMKPSRSISCPTFVIFWWWYLRDRVLTSDQLICSKIYYSRVSCIYRICVGYP